jgi:hypothetical protein
MKYYKSHDGRYFYKEVDGAILLRARYRLMDHKMIHAQKVMFTGLRVEKEYLRI